MEALILASMLSCSDGAWILSGVVRSEVMSVTQIWEIAREVREVMPDDCSEEQYYPPGRK